MAFRIAGIVGAVSVGYYAMALTHDQLNALRMGDIVTCCDDVKPQWWQDYHDSLVKGKLSPPVWELVKGKQYTVWYSPRFYVPDLDPDMRFVVVKMPNGYRRSFRAKYFTL